MNLEIFKGTKDLISFVEELYPYALNYYGIKYKDVIDEV